jgi:hypothetical protein
MENSLTLARQASGETKELIAGNEGHHQRKTWFANYYWLLLIGYILNCTINRAGKRPSARDRLPEAAALATRKQRRISGREREFASRLGAVSALQATVDHFERYGSAKNP